MVQMGYVFRKEFRLYFCLIVSICFVASVCLFKLVKYNEQFYGNDDNVVFSKLTGRMNMYKFIPITTVPLHLNYYYEAKFHTYWEEYKLHYCRNPKSGSTVLREVFCYISDPHQFYDVFTTAHNWDPALKKANQLCSEADKRRAISLNVDVFKMANNHFATIRDPLERFVSGWLYLCTRNRKEWCFNCADNINCFIEENYANIRQMSKDSYQLSDWKTYYHFYPQTWICNFDQHLNKYYLIVYSKSHEEFATKLDQFLESINVTQSLRKTIKWAVTNKGTTHASSQKKADDLLNKIYGNKTLLDILYKTYYVDYVILGEKLNLNDDILDEIQYNMKDKF